VHWLLLWTTPISHTAVNTVIDFVNAELVCYVAYAMLPFSVSFGAYC